VHVVNKLYMKGCCFNCDLLWPLNFPGSRLMGSIQGFNNIHWLSTGWNVQKVSGSL